MKNDKVREMLCSQMEVLLERSRRKEIPLISTILAIWLQIVEERSGSGEEENQDDL